MTKRLQIGIGRSVFLFIDNHICLTQINYQNSAVQFSFRHRIFGFKSISPMPSGLSKHKRIYSLTASNLKFTLILKQAALDAASKLIPIDVANYAQER